MPRIKQLGMFKPLLAALASYILIACSQHSLQPQSPPTPLGKVPPKIIQPEPWQCFQSKFETQWRCQKEPNAPYVLSLAEVTNAEPTTASKNTAVKAKKKAKVSMDTGLNNTNPPQAIPASLPNKLYDAGEEILKLPANYYAVQVLASQNKQNLLRFVEQQLIDDPVYVKIANQEQVLHILLAGIYNNVGDAALRSKIVNQQAEIKAWVRQLGALQSAIELTPKDLRVSKMQ